MVVLVLLALAARGVFLWLGPWSDGTRALNPDAGRYLRLADNLRTRGVFSLADGGEGFTHVEFERLRRSNGTELPSTNGLRPETFRTPGYPAFIALTGGSSAEVRPTLVAQSLFGALCAAGVLVVALALGVPIAAQGCLSGQPCPVPTVGDAFVVVDVADPAHPAVAASIRNSALPAPFTGTNALKHATSVAISGNFAYVTAAYSNRLTVIDISNPTSPVIVASLLDGTQLNFPVDVAARGGSVYVVDQITQGHLTVVDVSTPSNPHVVGSVVSNAWLNGAYRVQLRGNFAFASAVNGATVAAVDISRSHRTESCRRLCERSGTESNDWVGHGFEQPVRDRELPVPEHRDEPHIPAVPVPGGWADPRRHDLVGRRHAGADLIALNGSSLPANPTTQISATFAFTVNDSVSTVRCSLDGAAFGLCTGPTTPGLQLPEPRKSHVRGTGDRSGREHVDRHLLMADQSLGACHADDARARRLQPCQRLLPGRTGR